MSNEIRLPAIKIEQPIGSFYAVSMRSDLLSKVAFSSRAEYKKSDLQEGIFSLLKGNQRELDLKRSKQIGQYIDSVESTFPNSIILGANFDKDGNLIEDYDIRWRVEKNGNLYTLVIPSENNIVATIIDGQHRLSGFGYSERENMELLCSVFIDLPAPYQAYIFATINFNQKNVNKSLAYDLYGFRVEEEDKKEWSPEKLAVFIARRLNKYCEPLKDKIKLGAPSDIDDTSSSMKLISLSTIVDGVMKLITNNPKKDRDELLNFKNKNGRSALSRKMISQPLRDLYIEYKDDEIEGIIIKYFTKIKEILWIHQSDNSYLLKTIGFQTQFEILRQYLLSTSDYELNGIDEKLELLVDIDFSDIFFTASGIGATRMKNISLIRIKLKSLTDLVEHKDYNDYVRLLK
ncbi:DNA phosphorothioation-associated DGQHR protein 1 [Pantoea dispersa]|uniref:DNA phosphorothioation-associated DGQHR protein 1 n=1 Tax=Pantoea dispersa TaxID=59814 RepID=UPI001BA4F990|nr:DNA phosphorothioation-associated DGQHR protein 1 [Pantoea dispersa]MBS0899661.1 DGQHR domain-containing protein [Pantoea dispersa]